jgi:hypothetical protein
MVHVDQSPNGTRSPLVAHHFMELNEFEDPNHGDPMTALTRIGLALTLLLSATLANAAPADAGNINPQALYSEVCQGAGANAPSPAQFMDQFVWSTLDAGRCTGSYDCKWPTTSCVNNRCVKPNGDGGDCTGSYDCKWPTTTCQNGICVKPGGGGGECTGSYDCKWPYSSCKNGFCERP